ncbi:MAG: hypothetical protein Q8P44_01170 [Dehalococcoidia bacterium]|nr:hypothetical protein [Dehalococcoidia bacterium]
MKYTLHLKMDTQIARLIKMRAAGLGVSAAEYVTALVRQAPEVSHVGRPSEGEAAENQGGALGLPIVFGDPSPLRG